MGRILDLEEAYKLVEQLKREGKRVVFTNGCFDLLHPGHTRVLAEARKLGDVVLVAINSDRTVRALKGTGRPVFPAEERAETLAALESVDYVTVFDEVSVLPIIARLLPNVLVKGGDWGPGGVVGREEVEAAGGRVVQIPVASASTQSGIAEAPVSTSSIIDTILGNFGKSR